MTRPLRRYRRRRPSEASPTIALAGTVALHATAVAVMLLSGPFIRQSTVPVYSVNLVAAPRPEPEARRAPEAVERPAERPAPVPQQPRRTSVAETPPPPVRTPQEREPAPRTTPETELAPDEEPSTGSDVATVRTEGVAFQYPEYLNNIVAQVYRRWNRPRANVSLSAEVLFFVHRDGNVSNLQFVRSSGSYAFDLEAQGAIESAANASAFGPLPDGYPADVLAVRFFFDPSKTR